LVHRNGRAVDVAQAIVALLENGFITGVVLPCDGRRTPWRWRPRCSSCWVRPNRVPCWCEPNLP
jgi:hypothetical protein